MALVSALRDQLYKRLGITSPSQRETDRVVEALIAGIARAASDGIPGLAHSLVTAETYGESSATVSSHGTNSATLTLNATPFGTRAGDLLKIDSDVYSIYSVTSTAVSVGSLIKASQAAKTVTIIHRTVQMPTTGPILRAFDITNGNNLTHEPSGFARYGLGQGTPVGYEVIFDRDDNDGDGAYGLKTVVGLWPAPSSATRLAIVQSIDFSSLTTSTEIPFPISAFESIMERAIACWRSWQVGGVSPTELEASRQSVKDAETGLNQGSTQPIIRDSLRGRGRRH